MPSYDAVIIGAGLAGLSAARDLAAAGADVVVLEARARAGGRVEQTTTPNGRLIQLGGEVIADFHTSYRQLVAELGLTIVPSFTDIPGESTWLMRDGVFRGEDMPWMSGKDRAVYDRIDSTFAALAATVNPENPLSHPDAEALDKLSFGEWLRSEGATPDVVRAIESRAFGLAEDSVERRSLLADLRKESVAGATGFYDYDVWESSKVQEGSATVALMMADNLGHRIRYSTPVQSIDIQPTRSRVQTETGEEFFAQNVVSAIPVGPLRDIGITGVSTARLYSLRRNSMLRPLNMCRFMKRLSGKIRAKTEPATLRPRCSGGPGCKMMVPFLLLSPSIDSEHFSPSHRIAALSSFERSWYSLMAPLQGTPRLNIFATGLPIHGPRDMSLRGDPAS